MFRDIFVGWPGKSHDARVFRRSPLYQRCINRSFLTEDLSKEIDGKMVNPLIICDSAYPMESWMMKPYCDSGNLYPRETNFNFCLSRTRVVVENCFGRLKGRFRCLSNLETSVKNTVAITSACCILHNFCELDKQEFRDEWLQEQDNQEFYVTAPSENAINGNDIYALILQITYGI